MTNDRDAFFVAIEALAEERYQGNLRKAFCHLAFQLAYPTAAYTDDEAEDLVSIDRSGDLGADALVIDQDSAQVLLFQAKSSEALDDATLHDFVSAFLGVPSKLASDDWVLRAHREMKALANEFREAVHANLAVHYSFATGSRITPTVRSTFDALNEVPGSAITASIDLLDGDELRGRYKKLLLSEYGAPTNVQFEIKPGQMHAPPSSQPVTYLTISASEYVRACKSYGMELFRYNPRLYLGTNKVNASIAETLQNDFERSVFHLLNNGITAVCSGTKLVDAGSGTKVLHVEDFQVVNGCQTSMTLFTNSAMVLKDETCLIDIKIIQSPGLRNRISETTNSQTAIMAEDSFSNEPEQRKIQDLFNRHNPRYYYGPKRGMWEQLRAADKRTYLDTQPIFGRYRKPSSKELAAVCLSIFGEPESAKDKPRIVFDKVGGKNTILYQRTFEVTNAAGQWLLPFEILRFANALAKEESAKNPDGQRGRVAEYGRFRMLHLAYGFLQETAKEPHDFLSPDISEKLLSSLHDWAFALLGVTLDALDDAFSDAQERGESSGLREFFRERRHQPHISDRFRKALQQNERLAERNGQSILQYLSLDSSLG